MRLHNKNPKLLSAVALMLFAGALAYALSKGLRPTAGTGEVSVEGARLDRSESAFVRSDNALLAPRELAAPSSEPLRQDSEMFDQALAKDAKDSASANEVLQPTPEQRLAFLRRGEEQWRAALKSGGDMTAADLTLAGRCVGEVLRSLGRLEYGQSGVRSSLKPSGNSEHVFACDNAVFRFSRGEFPAYDSAYARALSDGSPRRELRPIEFDAEIEALLAMAYASIPRTSIEESR